MPSAISPLEDKAGSTGYTKLTPQNRVKDFEQEQIEVFAKIVTTLSQDINNPLEPHKIFEFHNSMTQMVQSKKQTIALENMVKNLQFSQFLQASNLVGEEVEVKGNRFAMGAAPLTYDVPEKALRTFIDIFDENGKIVKTTMGETTPGEAVFFFNHKGEDGKILPPGEYTYRLRSFVPSDNPLSPPEEWLSEFLPVPSRSVPPTLSYVMPPGIAKATLEIADEKGRVVQVLPGKNSEGKHEVLIDDLNNGAALPAGVYQFTLKALNEQNEEIDIETRVRALVESVEMQDSTPMLRQIGSVYTPLENYTAINKMRKSTPEQQGDQ